MFIIPCKFDKKNPIIFDCVNAIVNFHPNEKIVVVDSHSSDRGYKNDLHSNAIFYDVKNKHYALEAYRIGFENNKDENFFYCIHDSLVLQTNISFVEEKDLTTIRWWSCPPEPTDFDNENGVYMSGWADEQMKAHLGYGFPEEHRGLFGPMFLCSNKVMNDVYHSGIFNILPNRKIESCTTERILAIVLTNLGYDVTNAIQGSMRKLTDEYDETFVKKYHYFRG
jgi:hypothetical protein